MDERERLVEWMRLKGKTSYAVAVATGDSTSNISMIINGKRSVSDAFKWRFRIAYGNAEANKIFDTRPVLKVARQEKAVR